MILAMSHALGTSVSAVLSRGSRPGGCRGRRSPHMIRAAHGADRATSFRSKTFFAHLLAVSILLSGGQSAYAAPLCTSGPVPTLFTAAAPSGTFAVSPDARVGTRLTPWTAWQTPGYSWTCPIQAGIWTAVAARAMFNGPTITVEGKDYIAYPTSLSGVSLIAEQSFGRLDRAGTSTAIGENYLRADHALCCIFSIEVVDCGKRTLLLWNAIRVRKDRRH